MLFSVVVRQMSIWRRAVFLLVTASLAIGRAASPAPPGPVIVIGFVGGFVRHDNLIHSEVQLAARLNQGHRADVFAEAFENRRREKAHIEILRLLDGNHDGELSSDEKRSARIILYGHSWGASETVTLAKELATDGVPVLLTVQVDSVAKIGEEDSIIPANVEQAVNFFQAHGLFHGRREIRAADATRTGIIGNFKMDYTNSAVACGQYPGFARMFMRSHIKIECDPAVWDRVESLIRSKFPPLAPR